MCVGGGVGWGGGAKTEVARSHMDIGRGAGMSAADTLLVGHGYLGILSLLGILIRDLGVNCHCQMFNTFLCVCFTNKHAKYSTFLGGKMLLL